MVHRTLLWTAATHPPFPPLRRRDTDRFCPPHLLVQVVEHAIRRQQHHVTRLDTAREQLAVLRPITATVSTQTVSQAAPYPAELKRPLCSRWYATSSGEWSCEGGMGPYLQFVPSWKGVL